MEGVHIAEEDYNNTAYSRTSEHIPSDNGSCTQDETVDLNEHVFSENGFFSFLCFIVFVFVLFLVAGRYPSFSKFSLMIKGPSSYFLSDRAIHARHAEVSHGRQFVPRSALEFETRQPQVL